MMEAVSIPYFRELLSKHLAEFKTLIENWESVTSSENVPEDVLDEIRTTVGLTNLLMRQKMKQFGELIDDSENNRGEKEITCVDLQGFWDMVFHEVEKLQKSFHKLEKCQKNNWVFIEEPVAKVELKKKEPATINPKVGNAAKERAIAARQRLAEAKLKMKSKLIKNNADKIEVLISNPEKEIKETKEQMDKSDESPRKRSKHIESKTELQDKVTLTKDSQIEDISTESDLKSSKKKNKENVLPVPKKDVSKSTHSTPNEKQAPRSAPSSKKKSSKEMVPLQCLTRSARKALLLKENALKEK